MFEVVRLGEGRYGGFRAAEIVSIPSAELIDSSMENAKRRNQTFFAQFLSGVHRVGKQGDMSVELLFTSSAVNDQTYRAQVHLFLIIRKLGGSAEEVSESLDAFEQAVVSDFGSHFFDVAFLKGEKLAEYEKVLRNIDTSCVVSVIKREDANQTYMVPTGYVYYT